MVQCNYLAGQWYAHELSSSSASKNWPGRNKEKSKNPLDASQYQASKRDFSFEIDKEVFSLEVIKVIKNTDHKLIRDVKVFDSYEGEKINEKKKAIGFEVTIQSYEKHWQIMKLMKFLKI